MKPINEITIDFNHALGACSKQNKQVLEDHEFANVPGAQWKGSDSEHFENKPKPENNKIARSINRIVGQYQRMEMNAKIIPSSDDASDQDALLLQGLWRNDFASSEGIEAAHTAANEAFTGGFGAVLLANVYDDEDNPEPEKQNLRVLPINSAASCVVFNAGAIKKDKSDAKQGWLLERANRSELEEEYNTTITGFNQAVNWFDWLTDSTKDVYIAHYWECTTSKITTYDFGDMQIIKTDGDYRDDNGVEVSSEEFNLLKNTNEYTTTTKKRKCFEYALITGNQFLIKPAKTVWKRVPIIPQYGYHTVINGVEYYCGEVARQRDPQRFENMGFSGLMQIMAANQVEKPEYAPEQVQRFKEMFTNMDVEDYAYLLSDPIIDENGKVVHYGPIGKHMPPQIGSGFAAALDYVGMANQEQGGTGQTTLPSNASGTAVQQVNDRQDDSYQPLIQNSMFMLRALCDCWIDGAQYHYFTNQRSLRTLEADGSYARIQTLQYDTDGSTGVYGPFKNAARGRYEVSVRIGESHKTKKQEEKQDAIEALQFTDTSSPKGQLLLNQVLLTTEGESTEDIRRIARFENLRIMFDMGMDPRPKDDEEKEFVVNYAQQQMQQAQAMQAQQQQLALAQQSAVLNQMNAEASARVAEGQAAIMNEENDRAKLAIDADKAATERMKALAQIENINVEMAIKRFEAIQKAYAPKQEKEINPIQKGNVYDGDSTRL